MAKSKKYTVDEVERLKVFHPRDTRRRRLSDLRSRFFGRLHVIEYGGTRKYQKYWFCRCECQNIVLVAATALRQGKTTSCGCLMKEPRGEGTPWDYNPAKRKNLNDGEYRAHKGKKLPPFFTPESYYLATGGFKPDLPGFLYLQSVSGNSQRFFKFGISNDWPEKRCRQINAKSPYKHILKDWWCFERGSVAQEIESKCKKFFKDYQPKLPFDGHTETFGYRSIDIFLAQAEDARKNTSVRSIRMRDYTATVPLAIDRVDADQH